MANKFSNYSLVALVVELMRNFDILRVHRDLAPTPLTFLGQRVSALGDSMKLE